MGYARAARLLDLMEEKGWIGPGQGAKPREIFIGRDNGTLDRADDETIDITVTDGNGSDTPPPPDEPPPPFDPDAPPPTEDYRG